jgi:hypothetical protein
MRGIYLALAMVLTVVSFQANAQQRKDDRYRRRPDNYQRRLQIGQKVYNVERDSSLVEVVAVQADGNYVIRYLNGANSGQTGGNWQRSAFAVRNGCAGDVCTGDTAYNIERDSAQVRIVGIQTDGRYVIEYMTGSNIGLLGGNWNRGALAVAYGCSAQFCVGEHAFNIQRDANEVEVVAIQSNGLIAIRYLEGSNANVIGGNWNDSDLARTSGCARRFCVGDEAMNIERSYSHVRVVGIQNDGRVVIKYLDGANAGMTGANWNEEALARTERRRR